MIQYNLVEKHISVKNEIIAAINAAFENCPKGKYGFISDDMLMVSTNGGDEHIENISWDGSLVVVNTTENTALHLDDLYFDDLLYFYEIIEIYAFQIEEVLELLN